MVGTGAARARAVDRLLRDEPAVGPREPLDGRVDRIGLLNDANGLAAALIADIGETYIVFKSDWVLVTRNRAWLQRDDIAPSTSAIDGIPNLRPWTDDFNNLLQILQ